MSINIKNYPLLLNGELITTEQSINVINPANEEVVATCSKASEKELNLAVKSAKKSQEFWAKTEIGEKQEVLHKIAEVIKANSQEIARIITLEQGKTFIDAQGEVQFAEVFCEYFANQSLTKEVLKDDESSNVEIHRVPLGVVAAIAPWNFPFLIAVYKTAPAILMGNSIILKPAPTTPISTCFFGELVQPIVPKGLINIITDENELGPIITKHPDIAKISFTGSTATGKKVAENSGSTLTRLTLELGGNDPAIIMEDAQPSKIAQDLFSSSMNNSGQICAAIKRLYVHQDIYEEMCNELKQIADNILVGDGFEQGIDLGPLQNKEQYEKVKGYIQEARQKGNIISGGDTPEGPGYFIPITLVKDIKDGAKLVDEEQFGPILPIIKYDDIDEVINISNSSNYGLGASVWGENIQKATEVAMKLEAGSVWVNQHAAIGPDIPLSGAKESGLGVEWGEEGLKEFTQLKILNVKK
jgi:acyl-CoA reductase-like NAD-dependent aldehyde dehydrogenase